MAWYHQLTARVLESIPGLHEWVTARSAGRIPGGDQLGQPFQPTNINPFEARLMLVTTGGVHTPEQTPFDMSDSRGDTSYRLIPRDQTQFTITHDYYDHRDADEDINCLFPLPLTRELSQGGLVGDLADKHVSVMGHIEDPLIPGFVDEQLPELWSELDDRPDLILLSPG